MIRVITFLGVLTLLVACARASEPVRPDEVAGPFTWGAASNVTQVRNLWFAGQPDAATLEAAVDQGIGIVINLRGAHEQEWDEEQAVRGLGMSYYSVPVPGKQPFSAEAFAEIESIVREHKGDQILIHCSSSNRVGGWFATHLVAQHGMSVHDAIAIGRKVGITKDAIVQKVANYLGEPAPVEPLLE
jgi:protein tyrosine phosphatase (PTP) superfamily phosphohydrolase (DUF442 family)